jgi:hypothetical protein
MMALKKNYIHMYIQVSKPSRSIPTRLETPNTRIRNKEKENMKITRGGNVSTLDVNDFCDQTGGEHDDGGSTGSHDVSDDESEEDGNDASDDDSEGGSDGDDSGMHGDVTGTLFITAFVLGLGLFFVFITAFLCYQLPIIFYGNFYHYAKALFG